MARKSRTAVRRSRSTTSRPPRRSTRAAGGVAAVQALEQAVEAAAMRLHGDRKLRTGVIVFRTTHDQAPVFTVHSSESGVEFRPAAEPVQPLLEVIGDPRRVAAIVRGEKDARMQFFAGGIRVRGDMHYLNELGLELGFLKKPII